MGTSINVTRIKGTLSAIRNSLLTTRRYASAKSAEAPHTPCPPAELRIQVVTQANVDDALSFRNVEIVRHFRKFISNANVIGVFAYMDGKVIGHQWGEVNTKNKPIFSTERMILEPHEVGTWFANVDTRYRGRRIHSHMKKRLFDEFQRRHHNIVIIDHPSLTNVAALRSSNKQFPGVSVHRVVRYDVIHRLITIYIREGNVWGVCLKLPKTTKRLSLIFSKREKTQSL